MEAIEGFPDRGLADAELFGEIVLGQAGVFIQIFTKDVGLDAVVCESG
jgi:hypothetical protein